MATIVPHQWLEEPERLGAYTRELLVREMLTAVVPDHSSMDEMSRRFITYLEALGARGLEARQIAFREGEHAHVHIDKMQEVIKATLIDLKIAKHGDDGGYGSSSDWVLVDKATAADYMAALALELCAPEHSSKLILSGTRRSVAPRRIPVTDSTHSLLPLLAAGVAPEDAALHSRAEAQQRLAVVRAVVLENLFPAPERGLSPAQIEEFRNRRGGLLSEFRREVERRVDELYRRTEAWELQREIDRLHEDLSEAINEAEAYMKQSGFGRLLRSKWCSLLAQVPVLGRFIGLGRVGVDILAPERSAPVAPLAYAAFANVQFGDSALTSDVEVDLRSSLLGVTV